MTLEILFIVFVCIFVLVVSLLVNALFVFARKYERMAGLWREECNERKIEQQKSLAVHGALLNWTGDLPKKRGDYNWSTTYAIAKRLRRTLDEVLILTDKGRTRVLNTLEIKLSDRCVAVVYELEE